MTVDAITAPVPPFPERRHAPRFRFSFVMPATLGRCEAVILDINAEGARVMHFAALPLASAVRLVFSYAGRRFAANGRVLASRVAGLGNGPAGETSYQSRLQFIDPPEDVAETLADIIGHMENDRLRKWVSNAEGEESHVADDGDGAQYFLRCRLRGRSWNKFWTRDSTQPDDGFTVPAKLSDGEVATLCETYEKTDDGGRELIRATACHAA
jgi:hypothetical protein